ncbi:SRPBCC family protein [Bordetella petrii]|uniref:hypothetical protein n=1 Tax=Bordetella petrii TaxID=94624 RepID=UPI0009DB56A0|nr:hypothetical protein [Bordetella petrii]
MHTASQALAIERQASAQPSLAERVSRPKTRAILGLMRLNFLSVRAILGLMRLNFLSVILGLMRLNFLSVVFSWVLTEKEASDEWKALARETYVRTFGTSGMLEQDDAEMWKGITRVTKGYIASRNLKFIYRMGIDRKPEQGDWPGPGTVYQGDYSEANQLNIWRQWEKLMSE